MNDRSQVTPYPLRLSVDLREKLEKTAQGAGRSLNAEIVARLQGSFEQNLASLNWLDLVKILEEEARKRGATISITVG